MTGLLRPTLGPVARTVAVAPIVGNGPPEILDSAATIARRTVQLADPFEDMGGMIVRHLVWRVFEEAGDGTATAAVLARGLMHAAATAVAAGGSPVPIRRGIEVGLAVALDTLRRQARPVEAPAELAAVAAGIVRNPELAELVGEVVESVGPEGSILIEEAQGTETGYQYIDGVQWDGGYVSHFLLQDGQTTVRLLDPRVFVTDYALDTAEQLLPALEACVAAGARSLLVVAPEVRDSAVGLLVLNRERGLLDGAVAVRAPSIGEQQVRILEDLAVVTGGRCMRRACGERLEDVTVADLGQARQAWASKSAFGILGGRGDRAAIRQRIAEARAELGAISDDQYARDKVRERIGKLAGTAAVIRVGAPTTGEREELKLRVEAAVTAARAALEHGVVPGGGGALLACAPALETLAADCDRADRGDEAAGVRALARALAEPMRTIARNAGLESAPILAEARRRGPGWTFDVLRQEWVDPFDAGIVDPLAVVLTALETSASAVAATVTADVLIRRKRPPRATEP